MEKENMILFCVITAVAVCYSALERRKLLEFRKKCKISSLSFYRKESKQVSKTTNLKNRKWYYRGEGNEYLSLSLPETRQILRIKKVAHPVGVKESVLYYLFKNTKMGDFVEAKARMEEKLNLEYYHSFIALLGEAYVQPAQAALLDKSQVWEIDHKIEPLRPVSRSKKHLAYACGSLLADYAYFPISWDLDDTQHTFSVEIKPKQGWISPNERTYPMCTFCLNQYIKLKNDEVSALSEYCPMDLFSGCFDRMKYAIKCLLQSPQNNLKIFKDGKLLYGDSYKYNNDILIFQDSLDVSMNEFCDLIITALLTNLNPDNQCPNGHIYKEDYFPPLHPKRENCSLVKTCNFTQQNLTPGCVLDRILKLQKLDKWGSEEIFSLIKKNRQITYNIRKSPFPCRNKHPMDDEAKVNQYLMAAVAKDLSLMITFKRILKNDANIPPKNIITTDNGTQYAFQIGVFDLYPKKVDSIAKHANKRKMLAQVFNKLISKS